MFTGIINDIGIITQAEQNGDLRLTVSCNYSSESIRLGNSIACNGVCLTVVDVKLTTNNQQLTTTFIVELSNETISRSAKNSWQIGKKLNLERALKVGDTLDGHMVSGHIDGVAVIQNIEKSGDSHALTIKPPPELAKFIAEKGSVTMDGISLTVNNVENTSFKVNVIPHTWRNTTLHERKISDELNLEIDLIARYIYKMLNK